MVWRRRNQADTRLRVAQLRDHLVDLVAGQLAAFARLGALGDLDLDDFGIDEVLGRDAEAARGDLLDLRDALGAVARRILAALARIRAAADAVHRDRERLVRLGRQRAERHSRTVETQQYLLDGLDLVERHGRTGRLHRHQIAQGGYRPIIDKFRVLPVALEIPAAHGGLQRRNHVRVEAVIFPVMNVLEQSALRDRYARFPGLPRKGLLIVEQIIETRSLDTRRRTTETPVNDLVAHADDLEQLRPAVARDGRNTHLRHDFEQALADAAPVAAAELLLPVDIAARRNVVQRLVDEIRVDRRRAIPDQAREVMRVAGYTGLDEDVGIATEPALNQVMMHGACREQRMHRQFALLEVTVREHQDELAVKNGLLGCRANLVQRLGKRELLIDVEIDKRVAVAVKFIAQELPQFSL